LPKEGGALYFDFSSSRDSYVFGYTFINIENSNFTKNKALLGGGAI